MSSSSLRRVIDLDVPRKPKNLLSTNLDVPTTTPDYGWSTDIAEYGENVVAPWLQDVAVSDSLGGKAIRGLGWIGEQHSRIPGYDFAEGVLSKAGGAVASGLGFDPRIGAFVGSVLMPDITDLVPGLGSAIGGGATKASKKALQAGEDAVKAIRKSAGPEFKYHISEGNLTPHIAGSRMDTPMPRLVDDGITRDTTQLFATSKKNLGDSKTFYDEKYLDQYEFYSEYNMTAHHILDNELYGNALNRIDGQEILDTLNGKYGLEPGNVDTNLVGLYHMRVNEYQKQLKAQILEQKPEWRDLEPKELDRLLKDISKSEKPQTMTIAGQKISAEDSEWLDYEAPSGLKQDHKYWKNWKNRFKENNINPKKFKFSEDSVIMGTDHMSIVHPLYDMVPEVKEIQNLMKTGEWWYLNAADAAEKLARAGYMQQNIVINTAARRLQLIKQRMMRERGYTKSGVGRKLSNANTPEPTWEEVYKYMNEKPHKAAAAGWEFNPKTPRDLEALYEELTQPPSGAIPDDIYHLFGASYGGKRTRVMPPKQFPGN